jgi:hypothetical protein
MAARLTEWTSLADALRTFVLAEDGTQGSSHIDGLHWHVAARLVVEGGFHPDCVKPRPPFRVKKKGRRLLLEFDPLVGERSEATVLGGLKTKDIDVVVALPGVGPCVAVSMKGTLNAFRNLTNRLEEAIGDCANIHMGYPALVYGFLIALCANKEGPIPAHMQARLSPDPKTGHTKVADIAIRSSGEISEYIGAFHEAMVRLTGRKDLRDDGSKYESIGLILAELDAAGHGVTSPVYPPRTSPLHIDGFFSTLYETYDLRFVYGAKRLQPLTKRLVWDPESPAIWDPRAQELTPRVGDDTAEPVPTFEVETNGTEPDPVDGLLDRLEGETD